MRILWDQQKFEALIQKDLVERRKRQLRRATNDLAYRAVEEMRDEMPRVFDRPTEWVRNGAYVLPMRDGANSTRVAVLDWKPGGGSKSIPAYKILRAQIEGGARRQKRFEKALGLSEKMIAVPAKGVLLDRYGNLDGGLIVKILSDLKRFRESGYRANRAKGVAGKYTILYRRIGRLPPGVYARKAEGKARLIIAFVRAATYKPRLDPRGLVVRVIARDRDVVWRMAMSGTLPERSRSGRLVGAV